MTTKFYILPLIVITCVFLTGCTNALRPTSPDPVYYQIQYPTKDITCSHSFDAGLRIWDFTTSTPFNQTQIVVLRTENKVLFSRDYQWVDAPGIMITENLQNDLSQGSLFDPVVSSMPQISTPFELSGHVNTFACKQTDNQYQALLEVEVSLNDNQEQEKLIFHKTYSLQSKIFPKKDVSIFVQKMSLLIGKFSHLLQVDLCNTAERLSEQAKTSS